MSWDVVVSGAIGAVAGVGGSWLPSWMQRRAERSDRRAAVRRQCLMDFLDITAQLFDTERPYTHVSVGEGGKSTVQEVGDANHLDAMTNGAGRALNRPGVSGDCLKRSARLAAGPCVERSRPPRARQVGHRRSTRTAGGG